ncbi:hypothetical protein VTK56DRAFT_8077 [Thermocarpiscus australiensis]
MTERSGLCETSCRHHCCGTSGVVIRHILSGPSLQNVVETQVARGRPARLEELNWASALKMCFSQSRQLPDVTPLGPRGEGEETGEEGRCKSGPSKIMAQSTAPERCDLSQENLGHMAWSGNTEASGACLIANISVFGSSAMRSAVQCPFLSLSSIAAAAGLREGVSVSAPNQLTTGLLGRTS